MSPSKTEFIEPIDAPNRRRLPLLLRRSWYGLNQAFRRRIAHLQITPDQFTVLRTLLESDVRGLTQRELSRAMSSDPNTVASLLERMKKLGYVERLPHERDRRAHRIKLLAKGKKTYESARDIALALQSEVLAGIPVAEREGFLEHLSLVADACRRAAEQRPGGK